MFMNGSQMIGITENQNDQRLEWLEVTFPECMKDLKKQATHARGLLATETYEALLLITHSTISGILYLLTEIFLLFRTRKFSSDPTEPFFETPRRSQGCNDQVDALSAVCSLQKLLD